VFIKSYRVILLELKTTYMKFITLTFKGVQVSINAKHIVMFVNVDNGGSLVTLNLGGDASNMSVSETADEIRAKLLSNKEFA